MSCHEEIWKLKREGGKAVKKGVFKKKQNTLRTRFPEVQGGKKVAH